MKKDASDETIRQNFFHTFGIRPQQVTAQDPFGPLPAPGRLPTRIVTGAAAAMDAPAPSKETIAIMHPPPSLPNTPFYAVAAPPSSCLGDVPPTYEPLKVCLDDDSSVESSVGVDGHSDYFFEECEIDCDDEDQYGIDNDDDEQDDIAAEYFRASSLLTSTSSPNKRPRLGGGDHTNPSPCSPTFAEWKNCCDSGSTDIERTGSMPSQSSAPSGEAAIVNFLVDASSYMDPGVRTFKNDL